MIRLVIEFSRYFIMLLFPIVVTVNFAGMKLTRKNILVSGCFFVFLFIFAAVNTRIWNDMGVILKVIPLIVHLPIVVFVAVYLKRSWLVAFTSMFLSFLCYQVPRWLGYFTSEIFRIIAVSTGGVSEGTSINSGVVAEVVSINHSEVLNNISMNHLGLIAGCVLTYYFIQKHAVKPVRGLMERSLKSCLLFGALPFIYYVFDYAVVIYTDLMYSGNRAVIQFMPSFVSAFYLVFVLIYNAETEKQTNLQLEMKRIAYEAEIERLKLLVKVHYDPLTGVYNRRYLDENLNDVMKLLSRIGGNISIFMIDIDFFKMYNDTYGHKQGDECLTAVAKALSDSLSREGDFVARFGGEEFTAVLLNTDENGAKLIAEKMFNNISALKIRHEKNDVNEYITVSIGITSGNVLHTQNVEDYIKQADKALYMSKQNGRNRYTYLDME